MIILTDLIKRLLGWVWTHKQGALNVLLGLVVVFLVCLVHQKNGKVEQLRSQFDDFKIQQKIEQEKTAAVWRNQMQIAKEDYEKKVKALELSNVTLAANAERLSVALSEAKRKYANASEAARAEYTDTLNTVFDQCVSEYRRMAQIADKHAIDAERLSKAWPRIEEPP
ncbi:TPA: hypothetical protein RZ067_003313 [Acinetobacter baumannii]|nr:hypothetical protein [Acinetobacter baumannii]HEB4107175.1 hypothetical protein [Acinetobacter baumannii]HEG4461614.1 hypothetical protein [Acinetobacter baumannii]